jgi:preprotein translocase subunit YajC
MKDDIKKSKQLLINIIIFVILTGIFLFVMFRLLNMHHQTRQNNSEVSQYNHYYLHQGYINVPI